MISVTAPVFLEKYRIWSVHIHTEIFEDGWDGGGGCKHEVDRHIINISYSFLLCRCIYVVAAIVWR
jgi:hypothetical protein